jgi:hypothetical protein
MNETSTPDAPTATNLHRERADAAGTRRRRRGRVATIVVAVILPLLVWVAAVPLAGLDLVAGAGAAAQTIGPPSIVVAVLVAGFSAWGVLALFERFSRHGRTYFVTVGWIVLALSLLGPIGTGAAPAVLAVLLAMHVVTGATLVVGLPLAAGRGRAAGRGGE